MKKLIWKLNYKLINIETEKELNKFGYIYFNKIKKRTFIVKAREPLIIILGEPNSVFIEILSKVLVEILKKILIIQLF